MCGILAFFDFEGNYKGTPEQLKAKLVELSHRQRTRGPDQNSHYGGEYWGLCHERLSIMDPEHGIQPIVNKEDDMAVVHNGEIYNFRELLKKYDLENEVRAGSDSASLLPLWKKLGNEFV